MRVISDLAFIYKGTMGSLNIGLENIHSRSIFDVMAIVHYQMLQDEVDNFKLERILC